MNTAKTTAGAGGAPTPSELAPTDFVRDIVAEDVRTNKHGGHVHTRFPPEPNGYLHIGHAKSICLNFGIAHEFNGACNLRLDDTNPTKEDVEYVDSITTDVRWLIGGWADHVLTCKRLGDPPGAGVKANEAGDRAAEPFYASDYFPQIYEYALALIRSGKAYVCDLTAEDTERYRGSPDRPGQDSPWRSRTAAENLDLFERMKAGEYPDGKRTLRAKIDMASPNIWLRDPVLYRIRHAEHHHTGKQWCIYPMYDFAHCLSDYLEGITHSMHPRVRGPPPPLRLDSAGPGPAARPAAPVRICPAQPELHRDEQTQIAPARHGEAGAGLGRSPLALHGRLAPARHHPGIHPPFLLPDRSDQV